MIKLKQLTIHRFRNVRPGTLRFHDGLNVLLGQNGTGKTTLLSLISQILRFHFASLATEEFALDYELEIPGGRLSVRLHHEPPPPPAFQQASASPRPPFLREICLGKQGDPHVLQVVPSSAGGSNWIARFGEKQQPFAMVGDDPLYEPGFAYLLAAYGWAFITGARPEDAGLWPWTKYLYRFDESLDMFRSLIDKTACSVVRKPLRISTRHDHEGRFVHDSIMPAELLSNLKSMLQAPGPTPPVVSFPDGTLPFLADVVRILGFRSADARMELVQQTADGTARFGKLSFLFTRQDGSIITQDLLSYGQKRILTLLYYLAANPDILIADELVNGLHHQWIEESIRAIGQRQAFLTSQNPLLLDHLSFSSPQEVQSRFVVCRSETTTGPEQLSWSNFSDDEADMFFKAYQTGIQYVSEILKTRGLW